MERIVRDIAENPSVLIAGGEDEKVYAGTLAAMISSRFPDKRVRVNNDEGERFSYCLILCLTGTDRDAMTHLTNVVLGGGRAAVITSDGSSLVGKSADECLVVSDDLIYPDDRHILGRLSLSLVVSAIEIMLTRK